MPFRKHMNPPPTAFSSLLASFALIAFTQEKQVKSFTDSDMRDTFESLVIVFKCDPDRRFYRDTVQIAVETYNDCTEMFTLGYRLNDRIELLRSLVIGNAFEALLSGFANKSVCRVIF